ncbi:uncharacterized protein C8Q71DRAFT_145094 [Rhodofomes roseus]|uniref:DUF6534 domain-containing protein n=1 Tax=Rhodofomes roseus TaxID=34475 RepID=A0ABQ8KAH6_9APHY|nr:uncharacterized protein C8Q71DRAFT_145094 [Rhodofomes roseus]KAH9834503.1 hypothetical protein C8Q71DRAFT_145094 [Rhodofomes roseus]
MPALRLPLTCLQTYLYFTQYCKEDGRGLKTLVVVVVAADSFHAVLLAMAYYHYTVTNFGDYVALQKDYWSLSVQVGVGAVAGFLVQSFFAFRLYRLSERRIIIPIVICALALFQLASSTAYTIIGYKDEIVDSMANGARATIGCSLAANIACDLVIAAANVYYLEIRRTLSQRTNKAIKLLIVYSLNTYALATVFTLVCLITWLACPGLVHAALEFILFTHVPFFLFSTRERVSGGRWKDEQTRECHLTFLRSLRRTRSSSR